QRSVNIDTNVFFVRFIKVPPHWEHGLTEPSPLGNVLGFVYILALFGKNLAKTRHF
ncbi:hypothetical protein HMPREF3224_02573, partial [Anaerococcus hydrogenalis]